MVVRFLFCNSKTWWKQPGSALIRKVDGSDSSHFAVELITFTERIVYESVFPRARKIEKTEWAKHYSVTAYYDFEVPSYMQYKVKDWLESIVGIHYSVPQLLLIALCVLKPLNKLLNWAILNHQQALICTEVGSRFLERFTHIKIKESHDKIGVWDMREYAYAFKLREVFAWRQE